MVFPQTNRCKSTRAPVFVRDLSPKNGGLTCESPCQIPLETNAKIIIRISLDNREISLPARVTWRREDATGAIEFGADLELEFAEETARRAYVDWIVARIQVILLEEYQDGGSES